MASDRIGILVADDVPADRACVRLSLEEIGLLPHARLEEAGSRSEALRLCERWQPDVVFLDLCLDPGDEDGRSGLGVLAALRAQPRAPEVIIMSVLGADGLLDDARRRGAERYLVKPITAEKARLVLAPLLRQRALELPAPAMVGASMGGLLAEIKRAAPWDVPVLVLGPSGAGKELVAEEVHRRSGRRGAYVPVQLDALPADMMVAALFGWVKGAFTGATADHKGLIEEAAGGTLFLDEIGELPLDVQARLLRVIETRTFRRLGCNQEQTVDFRLVAATNRDPQQMLREGRFREDLYHRLRGRMLAVPPLSQRPGDLDWLVPRVLWRLEARHAPRTRVFSVSPGAMDELRRHTWPGNVRELKHVIENALINASADGIAGGSQGEPSVVVIRAEHVLVERSVEPGPGADLALASGLLRRGSRAHNAERLESNQIRLLRAEGLSNREIWTLMGIDRATFYRLASRMAPQGS